MRAKLPPGEQRRFLEAVRYTTQLTYAELAERCDVSKTAMIDWHRERTTIPYVVLEYLAGLAQLPLPAPITLVDDNERRRKGGRVAQQRRREHPELYPPPSTRKEITYPDITPELAEFIGIMLGDGAITQYQVTVTSNLHEEVEYADFVADLAHTLFGIDVAIRQRPSPENTVTVVLSSVALVEHLQELGLVQGNKVEQQCTVPPWIFDNLELMRACVRGLMDTDGCVYSHTYTVNGKAYTYPKMMFGSRSVPLLEGMQHMLRELGFTPGSIIKPGTVTLSRTADVRRYYEEAVSTHNPHHWRRYQAAIEQTKKR